jgi:hypothetical protein
LRKHIGSEAYLLKSHNLSILKKYADNKDIADFGMIRERETGKIMHPDKILINIHTFNLRDYEVVK